VVERAAQVGGKVRHRGGFERRSPRARAGRGRRLVPRVRQRWLGPVWSSPTGVNPAEPRKAMPCLDRRRLCRLRPPKPLRNAWGTYLSRRRRKQAALR
jgi:hypothetical protein